MDTAQAIDVFGKESAGVAIDQYLTFILENQEYGVDILRVQEIKGWDSATPLPNTPPYVKGVINLRGTIVPIIDLRYRFGLDATEYGPTTVVIVLKVTSVKGERVMGIVVDAVSEVYNVRQEDMKPAPDFGLGLNGEIVKGLATVESKMVIILDINRLLGSADAALADVVAAE